MGRHVYCNNEWVWKYVFAMQSSEQYRIYEDLGLGEYESEPWVSAKELGYSEEDIEEGMEEGWINEYGEFQIQGDILTLTSQDVVPLKEFLESSNYLSLKEEYEGLYKRHEGGTEYGGIRVGSELDQALSNFCKSNPDFYFYMMIETYIQFMKENIGEEVFVFEGEF